MKKIYIFITVLLGATNTLNAQSVLNDSTLNRTIIVEKEYNPIIQGASKINVLPSVEEPTISQKEVEYAYQPIAARSVPISLVKPMVAKEYEGVYLPGYLRLGYGNYGNVDAHGHYTFSLTPKDKLSFDVLLSGMNGDLDYPLNTSKDWKARYYKTNGSVNYKHQFDLVDLHLFGGLGVHNFNLWNLYEFNDESKTVDLLDLNAPQFLKQRFTMGNIGLGVKSTDDFATIFYDVNTQMMFYSRQNDGLESELKESLLKTKANLWSNLDEDNRIGLDVEMHNRFVNSDSIKNATTLDINPYYGLDIDNWKLRLGANIDLGFGYGESILVSPDIDIQYLFSSSYSFYVKAMGGRINTNFRRLETISPYSMIYGKNRDTYEQLNTSLGFKGSPLPELWFHVFGGFQKLKDDLYQAVEVAQSPYTFFENEDTNSFYGGAEVQYNYKDLFKFNLAATAYKWDSEDDSKKALLFKPKMKLGVNFLFRPIKPLQIDLNYKLVVREEPNMWEQYFEVNDISNLSAGVTYNFFKHLSAYAYLDNIMNKKYQYYYGYPTEGINFIAGFSLQF